MVRLLILLLALTFHWPIAGWPTSVYAEENDFTTWLELIRTEAIESGVQEDILDEALGSIELRPRIVELDRNQPEGRQSFQEYLSRVVPKHRVLAARKRLREQSGLLKEISEQYDVQPRFMVALWGLESDFGRFTGGFPVIDALATLAFDGRRSAFFRSELIDALRILSDGDVELAAMTGSWAGAMGQTQFMPSSYHFYAVDHDQDGLKDIWSSKGDIFASIANYLHTLGWKDDQTWG
ncbi:MAG TPA: lytic murein transglycosylase, partial [Dehalococcoidia bacterium]|nr:lytic murein transglycosylase [Dehalococcoidia bacterium]